MTIVVVMQAALSYGVILKEARYPLIVPVVGPDNFTWDSYILPLEGCLLGSSIAEILISGCRWEANPEWKKMLYHVYYG